jgi:hypothetical protein
MTRFTLIFLISSLAGNAQQDSLDNERLAKMMNLSEVVMRTDLDVPKFIKRVKEDTTFYKAFRTLHIVGFTSLNFVGIRDKNGAMKASLQSKTIQHRSSSCRSMETVEERTTGDFYDEYRNYNYYTGQLYAGLFFTRDTICHENNIVKGIDFSVRSKKGMAKHKEQLKMLFFNPGKKISGIPFMGDKIDIFDPDSARFYNFTIDQADYEGQSCYIFSIKAKDDLKEGKKDKTVIDNMTTWFNAKTMEVMARNYDLSYDAGVYDFSVHMEVQLTRVGSLLVPKTLRYVGDWDVIFKKRERGVFTATLFDFNKAE